MSAFARYLLAAAGGAGLLVVACEVLLRVAGYSSPAWYRPDPVLGWTLRPGVSGWFADEGRAFVRINSAGQRDRERSLEKPAGVYRIAVLGDAFSEGMQVALEETYWWQLGERLQGCGFQQGRRIEVLNFGVRGYGTAQAYLMLQTKALRYQPDLVLLQFTNGNDPRDNSRALDPGKKRPFLVLDGNGGARLDGSFIASPGYASRASFSHEALRTLSDASRTLQWLRKAREEGNVFASATVISSANATTGNEAGLELPTLAPPQDPQWQEAWRVTELLLLRIRDLAQRNGARLAVFTVPFAMQAHPDAAWREALQRKYGTPDLAYPDRRVASFARANGMRAIELANELQALSVATGTYLYGFENTEVGFGHWNAHGHRAAAAIIARQLCAQAS
ncbi:MAG TPA: SGNH/GDSL hydrolase family protein [Burkholderiales bacterium]